MQTRMMGCARAPAPEHGLSSSKHLARIISNSSDMTCQIPTRVQQEVARMLQFAPRSIFLEQDEVPEPGNDVKERT